MKPLLLTVIACLTLVAPEAARAQSNDMAAERARLANQRIQIEAESKAREEQQRLEQAAAEQARLQQEMAARSTSRPAVQEEPATAQQGRAMSAAASDSAAPSRGASIDNDAISQSLEQLRTLGELKDAGYVTADEFERIKKRILDSRF